MFKNYLKVALRTLNKNRSYAAINILGLALGLMVCIIVFLFISKETSYEKHFSDYERIYRIGNESKKTGMRFPVSPSPLAETFRTEMDEIETATRIYPGRQEILLIANQKRVYVDKGVSVDSSFFEVFDYEFIHGDPQTATQRQNTIVVTQATSERLFGNENPMDKIIRYDDREDYVVSGVVAPPAGDSHFEFNYFFTDNEVADNWAMNRFYTYFKLRDGVQLSNFYPKMVDRILIKLEPTIEKYSKMTIEEYKASDETGRQYLMPLKDIHLHSHTNYEIAQNRNIIYLYVFGAIAFLILLIAGINFMNLATARSAKRAKEVGVRKISGASKGMLISQFLTEAIIQSLLALFIAFIMVELFIPGFNSVMDTDLSLFNTGFKETALFALAITLMYGLFSGSYPAFFLSKFKPATVLKGDMTKTKSGSFFRKSMVVLQFTASTVLIIGMTIIFSQISFMHKKDLGFSGEQVMMIPLQTDAVVENFNQHKTELLKHPNIQSISRSNSLPGEITSQTMFEVGDSDEQVSMWIIAVDFDFLKTLDLDLLEGRTFDSNIDDDSSFVFILNETALKNHNIENPIGKRIKMAMSDSDATGKIVGVVKDFHTESFDYEIKPIVLALRPDQWMASIKIAPENAQQTVEYIESKWATIEPSHPLTYRFLDDKFGAVFKDQENFGRMFLYLTILAIIIAAMGLYGLASFTAEQRTKEIGIRKVLGASVPQLMQMLTKDFVKLVLIANIFAYPISLLLARNWLSQFTYQIDMPIMPFLLATVIALVIAVLTVSYQAYAAAISDPIKALKYE